MDRQHRAAVTSLHVGFLLTCRWWGRRGARGVFVPFFTPAADVLRRSRAARLRPAIPSRRGMVGRRGAAPQVNLPLACPRCPRRRWRRVGAVRRRRRADRAVGLGRIHYRGLSMVTHGDSSRAIRPPASPRRRFGSRSGANSMLGAADPVPRVVMAAGSSPPLWSCRACSAWRASGGSWSDPKFQEQLILRAGRQMIEREGVKVDRRMKSAAR